ncbi:MAG TPA: glycosyltransferase [Gemmatimonadales bacterium]
MIRTVVQFTDSNAFGGTERVMLQLLGGLDRSAWRPVLLHHDLPGLAPLVTAARDLGVELRRVPRSSRLGHVGAALPRFMRLLRSERPAVFHAHLPAALTGKYGLLGAALARVPAVVATVHLLDEAPPTARERLNHLMVTECVDRFLAVSDGVAMRLRGRFGVPERKLQVIRNGIELGRFGLAADPGLRAALAGDDLRPVVLTVARLDAQKGHVYLLEAAARMPRVVFLFAGEGPERPRLEATARALGIADRVHFLGHRADVPELLALCDLFVLPSLYEGLPLSVLEAMAAARPVVASAVGGTDEAVVHGETGLLVTPASAAALFGAISSLLADRERAVRMGRAGQARATREFSVDGMVSAVAAAYEELLQRRPRNIGD